MPLITTSVPNLVQGVSQQPDNLRYPGQAEEQVNAFSSVVDGLNKRPHTEHIANLGISLEDDAFVHFVDRDVSNKHVMVFNHSGGSTAVNAFNTSDGSSITTTVSADAQTYLNGATNPISDLSVLTVADYTFVADKGKTIATGAAVSSALRNDAIVFVKQGNDGVEYNVTINGSTATASGTYSPNHSSDNIASILATYIRLLPGVFTATVQGSVIRIVLNSDLTVTVSDSLSNTGLGVVYKEVSYITDLPVKCFNGHRVKVKGDVELVQDDYYVRFETKENKSTSAYFGEGSWIEDVGYGVTTDLDNTTMPLQIVPTLAGDVITSYAVDVASWSGRTVGDTDTNPNPSFVGKKINDLFFFKNRLGLLTDGAVIFSEADEYFNFFRTTVLSLLDSAPIDVGVAHTKVSTLKYATPFQEKLVLFSPQSQFVLRGADLLTPSTVNISPITEYNVSTNVKPLALTNYVYFSFPRDSYEGMYEFYVDKDSDVFDASEITQQVPTYVRSSLRTLVGTPSEDVIVASTSDNLKHLYVYKYFWNNKEKIQSSWMRFEFAKEVVGTGFIDSNLYIVTKEGYLEKMAMEAGHKDTGKDYTLHLDRRYAPPALDRVYNAGTKKTTVSNIPYDPVGSVVYTADGIRREITRVDATSFTLVGDYSATDIFVGLEYEALYQFSTQTLKQPTERGGRSASSFMSQVLRNGTIDYADTGHFTVEVTPEFRDTYTYAFNPTQLGANSVLGSLVLDNGSFRFPVHSKHDDVTITVKSSSALPMKLLAAEFESFVHGRSKRYGG